MTRFRAALLLVGCVGALACAAPFAFRPVTKLSFESDGLQELKSAGPQVALSIYPVRVLGRADANVGDVLGLILEKQGMNNLESAKDAFSPSANAEWTMTTSQFGAFIQQHPPKTAYALYAEFLGEPRSGPTEVRWTIADAKGNILVADRQTPNDAEFKKTAAKDRDPLGCSALVAQRMFGNFGWKRATGAAKQDGKFAILWAQKSGLPDKAEQGAMERRLAQFKKSHKDSKLLVMPTRVNNEADAKSAARLAEQIAQTFGGVATSVESAVDAKIQPTSNQQKRLWDLARALRAHVVKNAPNVDYVIIAEYALDEKRGKTLFANVVVCDRKGEVVLVDYQNDQHADFQAVAPHDLTSCERLTVKRLTARLK